MSSTEKIHDESSADIEAEILQIETDLAAEQAALVAWDQRNEAGEPVEANEKPRRRSLIEILKDRKVNAKARKVRAERRERLERIKELRATVEAAEVGEPEKIRALGLEAMAAMQPFLEACNSRSTRLGEARHALAQLGVPTHQSSALEPSPEHGGIALTKQHIGADWASTTALAVGTTRLQYLDGMQMLNHMVTAVNEAVKGNNEAEKSRCAIEKALSNLNQTAQRSPGDRYYRGPNGGVVMFGPDGPGENVLVGEEITEDEANHVWWAEDAKAGGNG